jgi:hypothetical protein
LVQEYNKKQQKHHTYLFIRKFQIGIIVCPENTPKPRRQGGDHTDSPRRPYWHWKRPKKRPMLPRKYRSKIFTKRGKLQPDFGHPRKVQK